MTISNPLLIFFLGMLAYLGAKLIDFFIAKVYEYMWNAHVKDWFVRGLNSGSRVIAWIEASPLFNSIFRSIFMKDIEYGEYEGEERYFSVRDKVITELATMMEPGRYYTFSELFALLKPVIPELFDESDKKDRTAVLEGAIKQLELDPKTHFSQTIIENKRYFHIPGSQEDGSLQPIVEKVRRHIPKVMKPGEEYTFSALLAALAEAVPELHDPDQDRLRVGVLQSVINRLDQTPVPGFEVAVSSDSTKRFKYTGPGS
ncbi:hypothetical protein [Salinicoccus roseus]|uniref:Uncharacterized protein n=1 Tax=Salinicoccus roseus TaxID=45670 RepID=A0A265EAT9_9STAP|nr:hypothetical protein [Salinicoccus roseus]OZT78398.1 hypothetical protein CFN03_03715 [Salinicoccus roseus]